jgi:hypothetical protein
MFSTALETVSRDASISYHLLEIYIPLSSQIVCHSSFSRHIYSLCYAFVCIMSVYIVKAIYLEKLE